MIKYLGTSEAFKKDLQFVHTTKKRLKQEDSGQTPSKHQKDLHRQESGLLVTAMALNCIIPLCTDFGFICICRRPFVKYGRFCVYKYAMQVLSPIDFRINLSGIWFNLMSVCSWSVTFPSPFLKAEQHQHLRLKCLLSSFRTATVVIIQARKHTCLHIAPKTPSVASQI